MTILFAQERIHPFQIRVTTPKDQGSRSDQGQGGKHGARTQVTHRNTALGETKTRCAITAKDKEKPIYGFKNDFSASTVHVLQRCATSQLT